MLKNYMNHWRNYFSAKGRMSRKDYWFSAFMTVFLIISCIVIDVLVLKNLLPVKMRAVFYPATLFFGIMSVIPGFNAQIMRLHDLNKSGWFLAVSIIPFVGPLYITVASYFYKGTTGENKFGSDPTETIKKVQKPISAHDAYRNAA